MSEEGIYALFAKTLAFPAWFGRNLSALADCLEDVSAPCRIEIVRSRTSDASRRAFFDALVRVLRRTADENPAIKLVLR